MNLVSPVNGTIIVARKAGASMTINGFGRSEYCTTTEESVKLPTWNCRSLVTTSSGTTTAIFDLERADPLVEPLCSQLKDESGERVVFLTDENLINGAFGGLAIADQECRDTADSAGLDGVFLAWLSDTGQSVADRFNQLGGPFVRIDGVVVTTDWADLTDGSLNAPINVDASGLTVGQQPGTGGNLVWTGTATDGSALTICGGDWSSNSSQAIGRVGRFANSDASWTSGGDNYCSNDAARFYCVQQ